ncbi:MAG: arylsulfotransferase (ASST) [Rhodopirellula sp.]|nr:arylsulfotransferase (ASST) [Rhodopirellula sp.]
MGLGRAGLLHHDAKAFPGYTLIAPTTSSNVYLVDVQGRVVRMWQTGFERTSSTAAYLLENGHLLRLGLAEQAQQHFGARLGAGGRIQEFDWDGELVWDFQLCNDQQLSHHDVAYLPNGNVLMVVWDKKTATEAIAAGRKPESLGNNDLLADSIVEVKPTGKTTGEVVWEWHVWDHLIQDHDSSQANFGDVAAHPERIDMNYRTESWLTPMLATTDGVEKLKSVGYLGSSAGSAHLPFLDCDWHVNSVAYHFELDQILVSARGCSEIWIIDHSVTAAAAKGRGGDLLYRWGNPRAYRAGTAADQRLFGQHDAQWIARGSPGEGHILVFNNGDGRPGGDYSSVEEIVPPVDAAGRYSYKPATAYGPPKPIWSYTAPNKTEFFSLLVSGAQRLPNGNTLICPGMLGTIFEVTPEKEVVWEYANPDPGDVVPVGLPPMGASLFAARRYAPDYPGLAGKDLTPGKTIEAMLAEGNLKKGEPHGQGR